MGDEKQSFYDDENEKNKSTFLENENKQMKEIEWKPAEDIEQENQ